MYLIASIARLQCFVVLFVALDMDAASQDTSPETQILRRPIEIPLGCGGYTRPSRLACAEEMRATAYLSLE